eukprot:scaffold407_cov251-Pinguiococcus_pyrenoidosus.AAC.30
MGGNASPSAADVKDALSSVSVEVDDAALDALIADLSGKDLTELLEMGKERLAGGGGGGGGGGAAAAGGGGGGGAADVAEEAAAEAEPEKEEVEEVDLGGGMDMFGGGDADY